VHKTKANLDEPHSDHNGYQAAPQALTRLAYSPSEGAQVLGLSRSKLYQLIASGDLNVVKVGSRTLVLHSELTRFLASLGARDAVASCIRHRQKIRTKTR
jgi:excisionase family DNA binding protein